MKRFYFAAYNLSVHTPDDVAHQLAMLDRELTGTQFEHIKAFNTTYLIITRAVIQKLGGQFFRDDSFIKTFDIRFVRYYTDALWNYMNGAPVAPAWRALFQAGTAKLPQFTYMALGVNAHVNNDIPQVLLDIKARPHNRSDFDKVNDVIQSQVTTVITTLPETATVFRLTERTSRSVYTFFMNQLIRRWRSAAWECFEALHKRQTTKAAVEDKAFKQAQRLALLKDPLELLKQ